MFGPERIVEDPYIKVSVGADVAGFRPFLLSHTMCGSYHKVVLTFTRLSQALHNKQMKEILIFGTVVTFAFVCAMVAIPERQPLR